MSNSNNDTVRTKFFEPVEVRQRVKLPWTLHFSGSNDSVCTIVMLIIMIIIELIIIIIIIVLIIMIIIIIVILINILNSCPTQGRVEGWDAMKPRYYRSVSNKGAGRPCLTHHHEGGWNETKWMRWLWRNGGMKFVVGENGRNPEKTYSDPVSSTTKPTWSDRDANSESQRWETSDKSLAPRGRHLCT